MQSAPPLAAARAWLAEDPDPETRAELEALIAANDATALAARFDGRLEFGTAGIRGVLGAGPLRMNRVIVRRVSSGLARYVLDHVRDARERGVVVGYDARRGSRVFAEDTARVLAGQGIKVALGTDVQPTPLVAFALLDLRAAAGVVVTASHNPPEYNGYKVYWENGAQIIPPHDAGIAAAIDAAGPSSGYAMPELADARRAGLLVDLGVEVERRYLAGVRALAVHPDAARQSALSIAYTPLHGVGGRFVEAALAAAGFTDVHSEPSQREPDGAFPTVRFPNPEEQGAMDRVLALAARVEADLVLANDPDADRLAVAVRDGAGYRQLSGDQVGALLADYLLREGRWVAPLVVTTIVSSQLLGRMARALGVDYAETLTGFKWIANAALERKATAESTSVLGYEEALGYCVGELVRDKDGIAAAAIFAELAAFAKARGETLLARLDAIYRAHGVHLTDQLALTLPGADGQARIAALMQRFRAAPPSALAGAAIVERTDLLDAGSGLPTSDVLTLRLADGARVVMRPSGTEPKLKSYYEVCEPVRAGEPIGAARERARAALARLRKAHAALLEA